MFDYDPKKSQSNRFKHGIDFEEAQYLWMDKNGLVLEAGQDKEQRFLIIARYNGKHWTAVYTLRSKAIRIISVRRSRKREIEAYER